MSIPFPLIVVTRSIVVGLQPKGDLPTGSEHCKSKSHQSSSPHSVSKRNLRAFSRITCVLNPHGTNDSASSNCRPRINIAYSSSGAKNCRGMVGSLFRFCPSIVRLSFLFERIQTVDLVVDLAIVIRCPSVKDVSHRLRCYALASSIKTLKLIIL